MLKSAIVAASVFLATAALPRPTRKRVPVSPSSRRPSDEHQGFPRAF